MKEDTLLDHLNQVSRQSDKWYWNHNLLSVTMQTLRLKFNMEAGLIVDTAPPETSLWHCH